MLDRVAKAATDLRNDGKIARCTSPPFRGGQCDVYKADFDSGESWSIRVPRPSAELTPERLTDVVMGEVQLAQSIANIGFTGAPVYKGSDLGSDNPLQSPFIALSWIPGRAAEWSASVPTGDRRDRFLSQLAGLQASLIDLSLQANSGAVDFLTLRIENKIRRICQGALQNIELRDCLEQYSILRQIVPPDGWGEFFAMQHGDVAAQNIIVDDEYNITGIIDWGFAAMMPLRIAAGLPRLLRLSPVDHGLTREVVRRDRQVFISCLQLRDSVGARWMTKVLQESDVDFKCAFVETLFSKGAHAELARNGWQLDIPDV